MSDAASPLPRLRQAVLAARDLDGTVARLRGVLPLAEPFHDDGVGYFGLRNAVFAVGDQFLEVVSPVREDTAAGRLLDRRGEDACGYMLMFQVAELQEARRRAERAGVREVFGVDLDDITEVHLHPRDMRGAIVSLSTPVPQGAWRWGGPGWEQRRAPLSIARVTVAVEPADAVRERWQTVIGGLPDVRITADPGGPGLVEIALAGQGGSSETAIDLGGVRVLVR